MEIALYLTDYFKRYSSLNVNIDFDYKREVEKFFKPFKNHRAIILLQDLTKSLNFSYDAPITLAWQLKKDYSFGRLKGYPFEDRLDSSDKVFEFLIELKNFAIDSNFENFYNSHKPTYQKWLDDVRKNVDESVPDYLNHFYKEDLNRVYYINLMPLQTHANYGVELNNKSICNLGIKYDDENLTDYYFIWGTIEGSSALIQHEFSHPLINPLTDKYVDINKLTPLPLTVKNLLRKQAYSEGVCYINEQVIRASTIIYCQEMFRDKTNLEDMINEEEAHGFIHTKQILKALKKYQKQDIPLREYYPKILKEFYKPLSNEDNFQI